VEYLLENFTRIQKQVQAMVKDHGRMPEIILLDAYSRTIVASLDKEPLNNCPLPQALKQEIAERDYDSNPKDGDCCLLVITPSGIMRTSYRQAEFRYALRGKGAIFESVTIPWR